MNSLIFMFILWVIFRVFSDRNKDKRGPIPKYPETEEPTYQLPPDLRRKWGPPQEEVATPPKKFKIAEPATVKPAVEKPQTIQVEKRVAEITEEEVPPKVSCRTGLGQLNPAMLQQGVVLSEILGPPLAKRRRNNIFH